MSFFDDEPAQPRAVRPPGPSPRARAVAITAAILIALLFLISALTGVLTDRLWFNSLGYGGVFSKVIGTKVLLFIVFGLLFGGFVFANMFAAYRTRPGMSLTTEGLAMDRYRDVIEPLRKWLAVGLAIILGLFAGTAAAGQWRTFLMWRNGESFGTTDPYFHKDVGFFVFQLPWYHYVVNVALTATILSLLAAVIVHYVFGGIQLQSRGDKLTGAAQVQISVLAGLFVLFKAVDYYLDRFDLTIDEGRKFTGVNYTAFHAQLPAKNILMFIALICALLFFANVFRRTWLLPGAGLGLLVLSAILLGVLWPGIVWQFQVKPSEPDKEAPFLANNIEATRDAYGVTDAAEQPFAAKLDVTEVKRAADAESLPGIRLIDPQLVNQTFEQLQQVRGYYKVADVLDVDRYPVEGRSRDIVLGARELDLNGVPNDQRNWANDHTVYTHGYGIIAAYGNNRPADDREAQVNTDEPFWAEKGLPSTGVLSDLADGEYEQRIYFGEKSPAYSIVGKAPGGRDVELDVPQDSGDPITNTYSGADGVKVGNVFNKLLYAMKFTDFNIVLSGRVNANSKVLYERHPRERLEKVAPWLTVDNDPYPAVVDGRVVWILDGYTMTDRYPNSQRESLQDMTRDTLSPTTSFVTLPTDQINYARNSVKATVDAYDGTVTLYEWDRDPILAAWERVFPGLVKPKSDISKDLLAHMRYPEDLFKVQRSILAQYHVTDPQTFYQGTDRWEVPPDPSDSSELKNLPPYRLSIQMPQDEQGDVPPDPRFSLTSVFVPYGRKNLASYVAVDSDAGSADYGTIRMLTLTNNNQVPGPSQVANKFASDQEIQNLLLPLKSNQRVRNGNLLTLPVADGLLYVQPVYAQQTSGAGTYPILNYVLATFGGQAGIGRTLSSALADIASKTDLGGESGQGGTGNGGSGGPVGQTSQTVLRLLQEAAAAQRNAQAALRAGDLEKYGRIQKQIDALIAEAVQQAESEHK